MILYQNPEIPIQIETKITNEKKIVKTGLKNYFTKLFTLYFLQSDFSKAGCGILLEISRFFKFCCKIDIFFWKFKTINHFRKFFVKYIVKTGLLTSNRQK